MGYQGIPLSDLAEDEQRIFEEARIFDSFQKHHGYLRFRKMLDDKAAAAFIQLRNSHSSDPALTQAFLRQWKTWDAIIQEIDAMIDEPISRRASFVEEYRELTKQQQEILQSAQADAMGDEGYTL